MYCCICGTPLPVRAGYCQACGTRIPQEQNLFKESGVAPADDLSVIDLRPNECHGCRSRLNLSRWDFALAKVVASKRTWGETVASAALSAATIPLFGAGMLRLPGKSTRYCVLRLQLVLCPSCGREQINYGLHPWWAPAHRLGYSTFLNAKELERMTPG
jgi:hypothetical protein